MTLVGEIVLGIFLGYFALVVVIIVVSVFLECLDDDSSVYHSDPMHDDEAE